MIKLLRVDHRLIHGQVALTWTNGLNADCILVANDEAVSDPIQRTTLKLAAPHDVKVVIKSIKDSIQAINEGKTEKYKLLVVVKNISDAYSLVKGIKQIKEVNIGGIKETQGSQLLTHSIFVTREERQLLNELMNDGNFIYAQQVPTDKKIDLKKFL